MGFRDGAVWERVEGVRCKGIIWGVGPRGWNFRRNVKRFQGGLAVKAHRLFFQPTRGLRVINKKKKGLGFAKDLIAARRVQRAV